MKGALFDLLDATAALVDVAVGYGWLPSKPNEAIWFGGSAEWDLEWATLGLEHRRDERYTLELTIETVRPNMSQREADQRADELLDAVGEVLLPRPTVSLDFGQVLDLQLVVRPGGHTPGPFEGTHFSRIEAGVRLHVRL